MFTTTSFKKKIPSSNTIAALILALSSLFGAGLATAKEWKSADDSKTFEGQLVRYEPPSVTVTRKDGKVITFKDSFLSEEDREYCKVAGFLLGKSVLSFPYRVTQVLPDGILAIDLPNRLIQFKPSGPDYYAHPKGQIKIPNPNFLNEPIFIRGKFTDTVAEGETYYQNLYWSGSYHFRFGDAQKKVIRGYSLTLDQAVQHWQMMQTRGSIAQGEEGEHETHGAMISTGSGFSISTEGHIVTNAHVVEGGGQVRICFGAKKYPAKVIALDRANDLAILKVKLSTRPLFLAKEGTANLCDAGDREFFFLKMMFGIFNA